MHLAFLSSEKLIWQSTARLPPTGANFNPLQTELNPLAGRLLFQVPCISWPLLRQGPTDTGDGPTRPQKNKDQQPLSRAIDPY